MTILRVGGPVVRKTVQATTSGTAFDFTIPAPARQIDIDLDGVSFNGGTDWLIVQLGDAGGFETTGYSSWSSLLQSSGVSSSGELTNGFVIYMGTAATVTGTLTLKNITGNRWVARFSGSDVGSSATVVAGGAKTLSATLTQVRVTRSGTTNTFDAGQVNLSYL